MMTSKLDGQEVARLMEARDEQMILRELRGELVDSWVYDFEYRGQRVLGLTFAGVKMVIQKMGLVSIVDCRVEKDEQLKVWKAMCKVRDEARGLEAVGVSTCELDRPFGYVLAWNKAMRNAWRHIIPEKAISLFIESYRKGELNPQKGYPTKVE